MKKKSPKIIPHSFEKDAWANNLLVCGIDEVGRGCLAGPLVICAAILFKDKKHKYLKDSKVLTPEERLIAFEWLQKNSYSATIFISPRYIDRVNIYQATLHGMKKAFHKLITLHPSLHSQLRYVVIDAMPLSLSNNLMHENLSLHHFPFGEQLSKSIAAASIIAKVTRDQFMERIDSLFPAFTLKQHKGYGTADHQAQLAMHGPTMIHRTSFLSRHIAEHVDLSKQLSFFE